MGHTNANDYYPGKLNGKIQYYLSETGKYLSLEGGTENIYLPDNLNAVKSLDILFDNPNITSFRLYNLRIGELLQSLSKIVNVEHLEFDYIAKIELPQSIGTLQKLKTIKFEGIASVSIPDSFYELPNLEYFDFSLRGELNAESAKSVANTIVQLKRLPNLKNFKMTAPMFDSIKNNFQAINALFELEKKECSIFG